MKYYWTILILITVFDLRGQVDTLPSYFMENEDVVFEFDIRQYDHDLENKFSQLFELQDYAVIDIIKSEQTNQIQGWEVHQINEFIFQLRRKLTDFNQQTSKNVKYLINGDYWVEPVSKVDSLSEPLKTIQSEFDLFADPYRIDKNGNTRFFVAGFPNAQRVILAGSFNAWNESSIPMTKTEKGWEITLDLQSGIYEYKFIVDNIWTHDLANSMFILNEHDTFNSILLVGKTITFELPGYLNAKDVYLSGSFNNWEETALPMQKSIDGWTLDLPLPPGKHYYKFIVDNNWIVDPENDLQEPNLKGNWNSVKVIN